MKPSIYVQIGIFLVFMGCVFFGLRIDAVRSYLLYRQGHSAHNAGKYEEAIRNYEKLLEINPDQDQVHYDMGVAYLDKKDFVMARKQVVILEKKGYSEIAAQLEELLEKARKR